MDPAEPPEPPLRVRRAGFAAGAAFLLLATGLLLPWWVVSNRTAAAATPLAAVAPFDWGQAIARHLSQLATIVAVALALLLLFVRVASRAWAHEPRVWRRDVGIAALLTFAALLSGLAWPADFPFWGGRTYLLDNATDERLTIVANPGLGWWLAALAFLALAWAWWASRPENIQE
jgi:hypothetical protein